MPVRTRHDRGCKHEIAPSTVSQGKPPHSQDELRPHRSGNARGPHPPSVTPFDVAAGFVRSIENNQNYVIREYQALLDRAPDPVGLDGWTQALSRGLSREQLQVSLLTSPEYINAHGGLGTGWLTGLYHDLLGGRTPSQPELASWQAQLASGLPPGVIALDFVNSPEREAALITSDYQRFLNRLPGAEEVAGWLAAVRNGLDEAGLETNFLGSAEFFARGGGTAQGFITLAYQVELGRTPALSDIQAWLNVLAPGQIATPPATPGTPGTPAPPAANADHLVTLHLKPLDINLLGLEVKTSDIDITVSADAGNGKLLGNLLTTVSNLIDLQKASDALNQVLGTAVDLLNSGDLGINLGSGSFDARPAAVTNVLQLHVAPVHLDLLGALVDTKPIDVSITAHSGQGMILGNIVTDLANLFNDLPGQTLNIDTLNQKLGDLLGAVNGALGAIPGAPCRPCSPPPARSST